MDGTRLWIERLGEKELLDMHLHYINECMKYDLWKDISDKECWKMREMLFQELRIRMGAE